MIYKNINKNIKQSRRNNTTWRTPQETTTASDNAYPHRTLTISLLYQSRNTLITHEEEEEEESAMI